MIDEFSAKLGIEPSRAQKPCSLCGRALFAGEGRLSPLSLVAERVEGSVARLGRKALGLKAVGDRCVTPAARLKRSGAAASTPHVVYKACVLQTRYKLLTLGRRDTALRECAVQALGGAFAAFQQALGHAERTVFS